MTSLSLRSQLTSLSVLLVLLSTDYPAYLSSPTFFFLTSVLQSYNGSTGEEKLPDIAQNCQIFECKQGWYLEERAPRKILQRKAMTNHVRVSLALKAIAEVTMNQLQLDGMLHTCNGSTGREISVG